MPIEILSPEKLQEITGKRRYSAQIAWCKESFGIVPARRPDGSIVMMQSVFEALLMKKMGLGAPLPKANEIERPKLRPRIA
ncbi:DUF4224 domain-containing protein [Paraburkholderia lycopersici]|uniref:Uncharacterized protein n=1 Tax=Paraburkholderia lycopersici TaxID=416944 RepID=A0A1G6K4G3_9BURK|nr:DUF4224 domain-containing protein [Paraburkholderia lycopersici]SDC25854.1 protein of unknown function [Paraburkholderia lycopersici]